VAISARRVRASIAWGLRPLRALRQNSYQGTGGNLTIGQDAWVHRESEFHCPTVIEDYAGVHGPMHTDWGVDEVRIGRFSAVGSDTRFIPSLHSTRFPNMQYTLQQRVGALPIVESRGPIVIGPAAWIGDRAIFLSGVNVGAGAVIGAGAVVAGDVPPFSVAAGVPARVVRYRFPPETIDWLLGLAWWDWDISRIERNTRFFSTDLTRTELKDAMALIED
jgi:virginiamycin A acetyltransferase